MKPRESTGLQAVMDSSRIGRFQVAIILVCACVAMFDGFDTQAIALAAPEIAASWKVAPPVFGGVFASGLFGALFGALIFGVAADRFGRKPSLLVAVALFSTVTLATPFVHSVPALMAVRFITGIGLGGALPGIISLTSEYSPGRSRATVVSLMFCGFPLGAVLGGVAAAQLMPTFGWQILFVIGSLAPLVLIPVIMVLVPESVRFLALAGHRAEVERLLGRMRVSLTWDGELDSLREARAPSIGRLFDNRLALGTSILTITFLLSLMLSYFLVNWLPLLTRQAGVGIQSAVLGVAALNLGAILGCLVIGRLVDRYGAALPIGVAYILGAVAIGLIGLNAHSAPLMLTLCFIAGGFSVGAQMCVVALCATFYKTSLRATGVGWLMGAGRIGAILGPILGGVLIARGMTATNLFLVAGGVSLLTAVGVFAMGWFVLRKIAAPSAAPSL
ncbi:MAG: 4-hydroxybenzoate transporter [Caulobacter sp.]|nr:4-hydroxybenzoate transporter [Caulobacter sp.]